MVSSFITAIRTLTILRIPGKDAPAFNHSLPFFPVVGAVIGAMVYGTGYALVKWAHVPTEVAAFICVLISTVLTGGIHLDGLADAADGLLCMAQRQRRLQIMKDSAVGTYGALSLVLIILLKWMCYRLLLDSEYAFWLIAAFVLSRTAQVELAASYAYARKETGTAGAFVQGAGNKERLISWLLAVAVLGWMGVVAAIASVVVFVWTRVIGMFFKHKIGGVTGDLLGAASELNEAVLLLLLSLVAYHAEALSQVLYLFSL